MRGEMPILLTLPIRFEVRRRLRRRGRRRAVIVSALLLAVGIALVVVGI